MEGNYDVNLLLVDRKVGVNKIESWSEDNISGVDNWPDRGARQRVYNRPATSYWRNMYTC